MEQQLINETFQYNGNPITFQKGNNLMVNATEMAKPFGKTTKDWLRTKQSKEFIDTLSTVRQISLTGLVVIRQGGNGEQGTWMHEDVALEFARWLSPVFAIWCNDRCKELLLTGTVSIPRDTNPEEPDRMREKIDSLTAELNFLRGKMEAGKELAAMKARMEMQEELTENRLYLRLALAEQEKKVVGGRVVFPSAIRRSKPENTETSIQDIKKEDYPASKYKYSTRNRKKIEELSPGAMLVLDMCRRLQKEGIAYIRHAEMFAWLRENGYLSTQEDSFNEPSYECLKNGWMVFATHGGTNGKRHYVTPYVTGKGYLHFAALIAKEGGKLCKREN